MSLASSSVTAEAGPRRRILIAAALVVAAGAAAHHNTFSGVFVFDDLPAIRDNPTLASLRTAWSPPAASGVGGRPLANFSYALTRAIAGPGAAGFHAGNLLLHLGSALLLLGVARRTMLRIGHAPAIALALATAVALLWVVHPLTTMSVTWLSQRTELLMAFFYLLTLHAFVCGRLGISAGACALGMMSKEVMITAPVLVLLYDRAFVAGTFRAALAARGRYYAALAATWLVGGWLLTTGLSQRSVGFGLGVSPVDYALTEAGAILLYLKLAVWPSPLIFDYGAIFAGRSAGAWMQAAVVLAAVAAAFVALRRRSALGFAAAAFFLLLAPTSSFVPVAEQPIAENRMYLPLALVLAATVAAAGKLARRAGGAAALAAAAFAALTVARNADYHDEARLWADTVRKRPQNPRAHFNLGVAQLARDEASAAQASFAEAVRLRPSDAKAHNSLGNALLLLGRTGEAAARFEEAVRLEPGHARAWCNAGTARLRLGDAAAATARFTAALRLDPALAEAQLGLGNAHFHAGEPARALPHFEAALRLDPALADAHYNAGSASLELGRIDAAIGHLAAAAQLRPADAEVRNLRGAALLRGGRAHEAAMEFEQALRLRPDYADARDNLALARRAAR